ncbi:MAG TPA: hypothetical protein VNV37_01375 [Solirubrobacteraceae bacterium]|jgi:hypothetical protein|nr:hypothetical protein [Solirubrobacteraceae bacterium]
MKSFAQRSLAVVGALAAAAGAFALAVGATGASASGAAAHAARTVSFNDTGNLHKTSKKGFNLYESGSASGSISGSISLHLDVVSTNKVTAELTVYPKGSSISGKASGSYRTNGGTASFSGTLSITHGSGSYSGAHGSGIGFSGTVQRSNDSVTVHVTGKFSS